jgi:hypothetical protein
MVKLPEFTETTAASSAGDDALFKEGMPRALKLGKSEFAAETTMGKLAGRMASKDFIDNQNLGHGSKTQRQGVNSQHFGDAMETPKPMRMEGPAVKEGKKVELEHKHTLENIKKDNPSIDEAAKGIAGDHLKEDPKYYDKLKKIEGQ